MLPIEQSINRTLKAEGSSILNMAGHIDQEAACQVVDLFCTCQGKVFVTGCGTSGAAAKKIAHTLCCVNRPSSYLNPADAAHGGLGVLSQGDAVVFLSKGGGTKELTSITEACREKGATTVAVTENPDSFLAKHCDIFLKVYVEGEPDPFNMLATASTLTVIGVMDAIAICVMERNGFTKEAFGLIHPGGAVGERLLHREKTQD